MLLGWRDEREDRLLESALVSEVRLPLLLFDHVSILAPLVIRDTVSELTPKFDPLGGDACLAESLLYGFLVDVHLRWV